MLNRIVKLVTQQTFVDVKLLCSKFNALLENAWGGVDSVADLLVLVICCPNGMIEMYMRRVRN
jgi:hypothetical protein